MPEPAGRLILMCGLPAAGKTTAARALEAAGAVRLSPDEWLADLRIDLREDGPRDRVELLQWNLAQRLVERGLDVVLENGFWSRSERDVVRVRARELGVGIELRHVDVPLDELWRRIELRNREHLHGAPGSIHVDRPQLELWWGWFEAPDAEELSLFDPPRPHPLTS